jgi:hypothetical protein
MYFIFLSQLALNRVHFYFSRIVPVMQWSRLKLLGLVQKLDSASVRFGFGATAAQNVSDAVSRLVVSSWEDRRYYGIWTFISITLLLPMSANVL